MEWRQGPECMAFGRVAVLRVPRPLTSSRGRLVRIVAAAMVLMGVEPREFCFQLATSKLHRRLSRSISMRLALSDVAYAGTRQGDPILVPMPSWRHDDCTIKRSEYLEEQYRRRHHSLIDTDLKLETLRHNLSQILLQYPAASPVALRTSHLIVTAVVLLVAAGVLRS